MVRQEWVDVSADLPRTRRTDHLLRLIHRADPDPPSSICRARNLSGRSRLVRNTPPSKNAEPEGARASQPERSLEQVGMNFPSHAWTAENPLAMQAELYTNVLRPCKG